MLSPEDNDLLTRVGPGTPMGALLRRYWMPIAAVADFDTTSRQAVRLLDEDLVLYRDLGGAFGLLGRRCVHRGADLSYGTVETRGLRCSYHGWLFERSGRCLEQPYEQAAGAVAGLNKVCATAYPVEVKAGLVWAYLGPSPAPLLPDWEPFHWSNGFRQIVLTEIPCNWFQCQENSIDPVHFEWLHENWTRQQQRSDEPRAPRHLRIAFDEFEHGFVYRRLLEGMDAEDPMWTVGRVCLWPNALFTGSDLEWRVPIDDETTLSVLLSFARVPRDREPYVQGEPIPAWRGSVTDARSGRWITSHVMNQDFVAWMGQGRISDRSREHLGKSDEGILLMRRRFLQELRDLADARDPKGILRDPARNQRVTLPVAERAALVDGLSREAMLASPRFRGWLTEGAPSQAGQPAHIRADYAAAMGISLDDEEVGARDRLRDMIDGYWVSRAIHAAVALGIPDLVQNGPRDHVELADKAGAAPSALYRLLRALASLGLFTEQPSGHFGLTASGAYLSSSHPRSLRPWVMASVDLAWGPWGELVHAIQSGQSTFGRVHGMPRYEYFARNPELATTFAQAMAHSSSPAVASLIASYDFSAARCIVDVGGGSGALLAGLLDATAARGVLFDRPEVVEGARHDPGWERSKGRCDLVGGDFFSEVPKGGDLYVLKDVLHNWDDAPATAILGRCRAAMGAGSKLLIIESLMRLDDEPARPTILDLHMLVMHGGRERTAAEMEELLSASGFRLARIIPVASVSILEAEPLSTSR